MDTLVIPYSKISLMTINYTLDSSQLIVLLNDTQSYILELPFNSYARIHREAYECDFYEAVDDWIYNADHYHYHYHYHVENFAAQKN